MNGWRILHVRQHVERDTGRDHICYLNSSTQQGILIVRWTEMAYKLKPSHATCLLACPPVPSTITPGTQNPGAHVTYFPVSYFNIHLADMATKTELFLVEEGITKQLLSSFVCCLVNHLATTCVWPLVTTVALSLIGQNLAAARMEMCLVQEK